MSKKNKTNATPTNDAPSAEAPAANPLRAMVVSALSPLVDKGTAVADTAIGYAKRTVETGARALDRTAKQLETIQERIKKPEMKAGA